MREIYINNEAETEAFGLALGRELAAGDVLALIGNLGTGKTALTKYIAKGLGIEERITSPTFTIVREYHQGRLPLYHFDVYRVEDPEELFEIGYEEYFYGKGVCVIEWADQIQELLPEHTKVIYIEYGREEGERIYKCTF
ncbi:MAG: tRNA (adenosine(37)-N6)-threonylcarbamoyltransferase complex ATPase subunit type 1 TsaE [Anaerovoracaceae bacterium]